ncbi:MULTISPECIES: hypothetical protein [Metallosphaera]|uniref:Uncharacterized protein n=2 Tax=Metallosphaera TaxID=41980 RepID=A0A0K1SF55_9CREN|nr:MULTISPECIES: hypothetical protein [Metallosphaera]AKV73354.1 hypothetical protein MsedA_0193 [Metallosphaera sedula]AKV75598.1 hypothetical protein MsedB_0193 [Metallosphaera sedula]AKV77844.1 hypothetical protein MsedC_0192 [Metallosphaera sedula]AKV80089.1 hypothetical protein MsedD_0193 [Metallosphaera sedula]AKV82333.1 hypothetical protein MsedE_0193 [Metallosphaera sedula]
MFKVYNDMLGNRSKLYNAGWTGRNKRFRISKRLALKLARQQSRYSQRANRSWIRRIFQPILIKE